MCVSHTAGKKRMRIWLLAADSTKVNIWRYTEKEIFHYFTFEKWSTFAGAMNFSISGKLTIVARRSVCIGEWIWWCYSLTRRLKIKYRCWSVYKYLWRKLYLRCDGDSRYKLEVVDVQIGWLTWSEIRKKEKTDSDEINSTANDCEIAINTLLFQEKCWKNIIAKKQEK